MSDEPTDGKPPAVESPRRVIDYALPDTQASFVFSPVARVFAFLFAVFFLIKATGCFLWLFQSPGPFQSPGSWDQTNSADDWAMIFLGVILLLISIAFLRLAFMRTAPRDGRPATR
jgi:hypothetical protein